MLIHICHIDYSRNIIRELLIIKGTREEMDNGVKKVNGRVKVGSLGFRVLILHWCLPSIHLDSLFEPTLSRSLVGIVRHTIRLRHYRKFTRLWNW